MLPKAIDIHVLSNASSWKSNVVQFLLASKYFLYDWWHCNISLILTCSSDRGSMVICSETWVQMPKVIYLCNCSMVCASSNIKENRIFEVGDICIKFQCCQYFSFSVLRGYFIGNTSMHLCQFKEFVSLYPLWNVCHFINVLLAKECS